MSKESILSRSADVLILAAGFGTRMGELTRTRPKPLLEIGGRALIEFSLELVARSGFKKVFVNVHYMAEMLKSFLGDGSRWGLQLICIEEPKLLETGGAIKNIEPFLEHDVLVTVNSDTLLEKSFSLCSLLEAHTISPLKPLASLLLTPQVNAKDYGEIGLDRHGRIKRFRGKDYSREVLRADYVFVGIQAISRKLLGFMPPRGQVFSSTRDFYPSILEKGETLQGITYPGRWFDLGSVEKLKEAQSQLMELEL